jgi:hypothetical protein
MTQSSPVSLACDLCTFDLCADLIWWELRVCLLLTAENAENADKCCALLVHSWSSFGVEFIRRNVGEGGLAKKEQGFIR